MEFLKIVAILLLSVCTGIQCSVFPAHTALALPAPPLVRYTNVAPPSVLPFSAQVSTFSRHLHVFDAPYAAGVLPGSPAIVQRAVVPGVPHAHLYPASAVLPATPHLHAHARFAPALPAVAAAPHFHAAAPHIHAAAPQFHAAAPQFHAAAPHLHAAAPQFQAAAPAHLHATAPQFYSAAPHLHAAVSPHLHAGLAGYHAHAYAGPHSHGAVARAVHTHSLAPGVFPGTAIAEGPLLG